MSNKSWHVFKYNVEIIFILSAWIFTQAESVKVQLILHFILNFSMAASRIKLIENEWHVNSDVKQMKIFDSGKYLIDDL